MVNETRLSLSCNNPKHSGSLAQLSSADLKYYHRGARALRALTGFIVPKQPFWDFYPHLLLMGLGPPFQVSPGLQ